MKKSKLLFERSIDKLKKKVVVTNSGNKTFGRYEILQFFYMRDIY